ncbi:MAG: metal ABC transporter permease [Phycisphaeraceae bacterium]|nr:metal ABC transporter permease [Phycisphaeraceae bacterium]MCB9848298.1 metal ABC transporter permease [Phycisphaeraceae bacterium]
MHGHPEHPIADADLAWAIAAGVCVALQCALLSVLVVLKRMAFIGQGVSHAALGGVGIAAVLGYAHGPIYFIIVGGACVAAALLVGWLRDNKAIAADTAIGIVLVASMALGVALLQLAEHGAESEPGRTPSHEWEALLFGSLSDVGMPDAIVALALLLVTGALALRYGRAVLFWAFDERAAVSFGARTGAAQVGLMIALAATIVASMKLVGVILATALLVLPGACALRLSRRLPVVMAFAAISALLALAIGLAAAAMWTIPIGAAVVLALTCCYAATWPLARFLPPGWTRRETTPVRRDTAPERTPA